MLDRSTYRPPQPRQQSASRAQAQAQRRDRHCTVKLPPGLTDALIELAIAEELSLPALVVVLINAGLSARLSRTRRGAQ
jgi:hypothetical protein